MYVCTVILLKTERQFWRMTPRKLNALVGAHIELNNSSSDEEERGHIDNVF